MDAEVLKYTGTTIQMQVRARPLAGRLQVRLDEDTCSPLSLAHEGCIVQFQWY